MKEQIFPSREQIRYADILFYGCWIGLGIMLLTYMAYVTGLVQPHIPLAEMPRYWSQPVAYYLKEAQVPTGWGWLRLLRYGDFLNFIGIVLLAGLTIICYLMTIPSFFRKGDKALGLIAIAEVVALLVAASGVAGSGGH